MQLSLIDDTLAIEIGKKKQQQQEQIQNSQTHIT